MVSAVGCALRDSAAVVVRFFGLTRVFNKEKKRANRTMSAADVRSSHSGLRFEAPPSSLLGNVLTVTSLFLMFGAVLLAPVLVLVASVLALLFPVFLFTLVALLVSTIFVARGPWLALRRFPLFDHWRSFFSFRVHMEAPCPTKSLVCAFPHGVFPLGLFLASGATEEIFPNHAPHVRHVGAVASVFFWLPLLAPLLTWIGSVPANLPTIRHHLDHDDCVFLLPEGIAGVFQTSWTRERIFLQTRKGFIRVAMACGANLVPAYVFGQSHLLSVLPGSGSLLERWSRRMRVSMSLFFGEFFLPIPRAIPVLMVLGEAVPCAVNEAPSQEEVDALHSQFCGAIVALFEKHKHAYGWGDRVLEIV